MTLDAADFAHAVRLSLIYPGFCFEWIPSTGKFIVTPPAMVEEDLDLLAEHHPFVQELRPCGTHAAFARHRARGEEIDERCWRAERRYQRDRKRARKQRESVNNRCTPPRSDTPTSTGLSAACDAPILTSPSGSPMLISVAGQGNSASPAVVEAPASYRDQTVGADSESCAS